MPYSKSISLHKLYIAFCIENNDQSLFRKSGPPPSKRPATQNKEKHTGGIKTEFRGSRKTQIDSNRKADTRSKRPKILFPWEIAFALGEIGLAERVEF